MKAIEGRYVVVFVSRLSPETTRHDMEDYIRDVHHMSSTCNKLKTKYDSYASFKVEVRCESIADFCSPEKWPARAYIRKFLQLKQT